MALPSLKKSMTRTVVHLWEGVTSYRLRCAAISQVPASVFAMAFARGDAAAEAAAYVGGGVGVGTEKGEEADGGGGCGNG